MLLYRSTCDNNFYTFLPWVRSIGLESSCKFGYLYSQKPTKDKPVFVNNSLSQFQTVNAGVPQGSVLGPFLFLLYINDISDKLISLSRLFADDTSMSARSQNNTELKEILNHDLEELVVWSKKNGKSNSTQAKPNCYALVKIWKISIYVLVILLYYPLNHTNI